MWVSVTGEERVWLRATMARWDRWIKWLFEPEDYRFDATQFKRPRNGETLATVFKRIKKKSILSNQEMDGQSDLFQRLEKRWFLSGEVWVWFLIILAHTVYCLSITPQSEIHSATTQPDTLTQHIDSFEPLKSKQRRFYYTKSIARHTWPLFDPHTSHTIPLCPYWYAEKVS